MNLATKRFFDSSYKNVVSSFAREREDKDLKTETDPRDHWKKK